MGRPFWPSAATSNHKVASRCQAASHHPDNTEKHNPVVINASPAQSEWLRAHAKSRERIWKLS